jgi:hypothetical protein
MPKSLLILKASNDICGAEIENLQSIAHMFGMQECVHQIASIDDFRNGTCSQGKYDYIYLAAHADLVAFGTSDGAITIGWDEFALALCETDCLHLGSILLLGCCRGGLKGVAQTLFYGCDKIDYVCGPRWTVTAHDITAGFHTFVYNMEVRREQPSSAAERSSKATGYDFFCYDRIEFEDEYRTMITAIRNNPQ